MNAYMKTVIDLCFNDEVAGSVKVFDVTVLHQKAGSSAHQLKAGFAILVMWFEDVNENPVNNVGGGNGSD